VIAKILLGIEIEEKAIIQEIKYLIIKRKTFVCTLSHASPAKK
jgi:hypothetical protein